MYISKDFEFEYFAHQDPMYEVFSTNILLEYKAFSLTSVLYIVSTV